LNKKVVGTLKENNYSIYYWWLRINCSVNDG